MTSRSKNFGFVIPTPEEDAAIAAGIAADPDAAPEMGAAFFDRATLFQGDRLVRRGRPPLPETRPTLNMRIDADVLAALKATGPGWQTRVNALLREAVERGLG